MKNYLKISVVILAGLFVNTNLITSQNGKLHAQPTYIRLKGETEVKEITLPLRDSLDYVSIKVSAMVLSGDLSIEIFDPLGGKHGNFSLEGQMDATATAKLKQGETIISDDLVSGNLMRTIKNPPIGAWKAKIVTNKAVGTITFNFTRDVVVYHKN